MRKNLLLRKRLTDQVQAGQKQSEVNCPLRSRLGTFHQFKQQYIDAQEWNALRDKGIALLDGVERNP